MNCSTIKWSWFVYITVSQIKICHPIQSAVFSCALLGILFNVFSDLDEKFRKRDRYMGGVVTDFKEKNAYKPDVKLEYIDEAGRIMNPKEAFRYKYGVLEMRVGNRQ